MSDMSNFIPNTAINDEYTPLLMPMDISLKVVSLATQGYLYDASGDEVGYLKQRLFKLKEAIEIYDSSDKNYITHTIDASHILDIGSGYEIYSKRYGLLGKTKRMGLRSLWQTKYEIYNHNDEWIYTIELINPWAKVIEMELLRLPIIGGVLALFSGYFLNPTYHSYDNDNKVVAAMKKLPAFWEGKYHIEKLDELDEMIEELIVLSFFVVVLIEGSSDG